MGNISTISFLGLGIAHGVFILLIMQKLAKPSYSKTLLQLFLAIFTFILVEETFKLSSIIEIRFMGIIAEYIALPTLYFLLLSFVGSFAKPALKKHALVPIIVTIIAGIALLKSGPTPNLSPIAILLYGIKPVFYGIYGHLIYKEIKKMWPLTKNGQRQALKSFSIWVTLFYIAAFINSANFLLFSFGYQDFTLARLFCIGILVATIHTLGYIVLLNKPLQGGYLVKSLNKNSLARLENNALKIKNMLLNKKLYLDPEISLRNLSLISGLNEKELSQAIDHEFSCGFSDIIGKLRIEEFKTLAQQKFGQNISILTLAFDAGFNSKAAFYKVFKKFENLTPTEYLKNLPQTQPAE